MENLMKEAKLVKNGKSVDIAQAASPVASQSPISPSLASFLSAEEDDHDPNRKMTIAEFRKIDPFTISLDATDNLYFYFLPKKWATWWYCKILLNKKYAIVWVILAIIFTCMHMTEWLLTGKWGWFSVPGFLCVFSLAMSYNISLNLPVMREILKTFDFWFKTMNLLTSVVGYGVVNANAYIVETISALACFFAACFLVFMCDALYGSYTVKILLMVSIVGGGALTVVFQYVVLEDVFWDPLPFLNVGFTQISFKNLFISGLFNVVLFTCKALVPFIKNGVSVGPHGARVKSTIIGKKAYLEWKQPQYQHNQSVQRQTKLTPVSPRGDMKSIDING